MTCQQVVAHAEARRHFPGSTVFSRFGGGEYRHPMSGDVDAAFAGAVLTSDAKPAEIYLWYQLCYCPCSRVQIARARSGFR